MGFKEKIVSKLAVAPESVPGSYQLIGDVVLMKFVKGTESADKKKIATAALDMFPYVRVVCETKGIDGELRKPRVKILASRDDRMNVSLKRNVRPVHAKLETLHKEHGILYKLDVGKIMFSKGNLNERQRLISKIRPGETVVDMFAGIGYFSLGIAKGTEAEVIAIEKNKLAYKYLKENVILNKLPNVKTVLGDCRKVRRKIKSDRVVMGYFPGTHKFLPAAFRFLKNEGVIHYHNIYSDGELWKKPLDEIENAARKSGFKIASLTNRVVKSYKPYIRHVVIDAGVEKV